ncbi:MAG TPA: asparagine synthase (glutamine-hydrolyzing) [Thermoanaerobaculia bacterium]|nr:asparagine synthase (glutamine-hydrolyzing) [Thermoanaerobaculia bacterium]
MCGIFGFSGAPAPRLLAEMAQRLRHRGPDDTGCHTSPGISMGTDRLAIVGVTDGQQPLFNEDGSLALVVNGEIYNSASLRSRLERLGHRFSTSADGEVILHVFEEEREASFSRLEGMFALALWDERRRRLILARDPMGMKPLFFVRHDGRFAFASEVKALLCLPGLERRVDVEALSGLLELGSVPRDRTLFAGIRRLPPGHLLWLEASGEVRQAPFWRPPAPGASADGRRNVQNDPVPEFVRIFTGAVQSHLMSEVPLGASLSGGLDSSLVVAAMSRATGAPVKTFSVGFSGERDERPFARIVADHCRSDHREVTLSGQDVLRTIPQLLWHLEEPRNGPMLPNHLLFERAAREVKVVLVGEGADELFGGYLRFKTSLGPLGYLPSPLGRAAYLAGHRGGTQARVALRPELRDSFPPSSWHEALGQAFLRRGERRSQALLGFEQAERLPNSHLMRVDLLAMAHSVEARLPYLDRGVVEFANRLPLVWKTRLRGEKRILREAARAFLPAAICDRPKLGQGNPLRTFVRSGFLDLARDLLRPSAVEGRGLFRSTYLKQLLRRVERGPLLPFDLGRLHLFVLIEAWHRIFIDPAEVVPPASTLLLPAGEA